MLQPAYSRAASPPLAGLALACALLCARPATAQDPPAAVAAAGDVPAAALAGDAERGTLIARRDAAQQTFLRLNDEQRYAEAAAIAAQIVDLTQRAYGDGSVEMAAPLTNLATTQMLQGELAEAADNYMTGIAIIERTEGLASPRLVNPLVGLGETYGRQGLYAQARDAYQRALRTNHAEAGFYNLEQLKIMDGLSEAQLGLGKLEAANAQQRLQVAIQRRRSGANSEEVVPALYKLGRWYNRTGQYAESRDAYQAARRVLRTTRGDTDPAVVDALIGEALTYTNEGAVPTSAAMLKRALDLLAAQPQPDHRKRAEVLVALGDLYTLSRQPRSARQRYGQAWQELSADPALQQQREIYFGQVSRIAGPRLPDAVGTDGKPLSTTAAAAAGLSKGMVLAALTVDPDGDASNIRVIESDPPGLLDQQVLRALDSTAFRPRLVDGAPVASEGVQFRHEFRYLRAAPAAEADTDTDETGPAGRRGDRIGYPEQEDTAGDPEGQR